jgi:S1-C subfamily serine protease
MPTGRGVPQDFAEAVRWYRLAAAQGNAPAQNNLGAMYGNGEGVPQDYAEAARWYRLAADQGYAPAQFNLGATYDDGKGVPQDYAEAVRWYRLAAAQGNASAEFNLGVMYYNGQGVPQNYAEAVRWYRLAAAQGNAIAQLKLGAAYVLGQGVTQDDVQAYMWLNLGATRSDGELRKRSAELRDEVAARLTPVQRARAQELARNWRPESQPVPQLASPPRALTDEESLGMSAALEGVQAKLAALGYDPGPVDGVMGRRTRAAIRAFEADVGLPVDGQTSDQLIAALSDAVANGPRVAARAAPPERHLDSTGTGFAVSEDGEIVTNHHVVADCAEVRVRPPGHEAMVGAVVARDAGNDLALLRAPARLPAAVLREGSGIRPGDSVVAVGFPLPELLASEANVTTGTVSALAGIGNDARFLQMTVPVQPGNSGGPLLDLEGRVVGVVVGKLDALKVASVTGDIPQNVNFAIKAGVVRTFLQANGVAQHITLSLEQVYGRQPRELSPAAIGQEPRELSPAAIAAQAKEFTVLVECWK